MVIVNQHNATERAIAVRNGAPVARCEYTPDQVDLIRKLLCRDATNDELQVFISQCQRTGLDPFSRQIHAVKRGGKLTIQVGIDGLRLVAERSGETDGQEGPYWCGPDGVWKDVWLENTKPAAAKVIVYRKGQRHGYTGIARWAEYYSPTGGMWDRLPATMIAKVAESIALRKGFPQELSGIYTDDEMGQAEGAGQAEPRAAHVETPPPVAKQQTAIKSAEPATLSELRERLSANAPTDGVKLREYQGRVGDRIKKLVPDFDTIELNDVLCMNAGFGEVWGYESLSKEQVAAGWRAILALIDGMVAEQARSGQTATR